MTLCFLLPVVVLRRSAGRFFFNGFQLLVSGFLKLILTLLLIPAVYDGYHDQQYRKYQCPQIPEVHAQAAMCKIIQIIEHMITSFLLW